MEFWMTPNFKRPTGRKPWDELSYDQRRKRMKQNKNFILTANQFKQSLSSTENQPQASTLYQPREDDCHQGGNNFSSMAQADNHCHIKSNNPSLAEISALNAKTVNDVKITISNGSSHTIIAMCNKNESRQNLNISIVSDSIDSVSNADVVQVNHNDNDCSKENRMTTSKSTFHNSNGQNIEFTFENFINNIGKCIVDNEITLTQSKAFLHVLRTHPQLKMLPKDPRSIIKTPRNKLVLKIVSPGEYLHIGLECKLKSILNRVVSELIPEELLIDFSTDGAELNKKFQFWPIQIRVVNIVSQKNPELVGIFVGESKPNDFTDFFDDFVKEANGLISRGGVFFNNQLIPMKFRCYIADAPARAYVLGTISHNGTYPCSKCVVEGITYRKAKRFPGINYTERTDSEFRSRNDVDHNLKKSAIHDLNINLVKQVPFDYMHLVCLGVMKKLIQSLIFGKCSIGKLQNFEVNFLSNRLLTLQNYCPREFARIPREIENYSKYKATEFRQLLLYTFIVASSGIITEKQYNHFLYLHTAMHVLLNNDSPLENIDFADEALKRFVIEAESIHGLEFMSYNIHGLLHIVTDYKNFGSLESTSAFPYENSMRKYRGYVRKPNQPLQQIHKRISEESLFQSSDNIKTDESFKAYGKHENGPILDMIRVYGCLQYENLKTPKFFYSIQVNENTIITNDNQIGLIKNIIYCKNNYFFAVQFFKTLQPFYSTLSKPSTIFGVFLCSDLDDEISYILYTEVKSKCFRMPIWLKKMLTPHVNDEQLNNAYLAIVML